MSDEQKSIDNTSNDSSQPPNRSTRKIWLASGLVLWLVALAVLYRTFQTQSRVAKQGLDSDQPVIVIDENTLSDPAAQNDVPSSGESKSAGDEQAKKVSDPAMTWDPKGIEDFALTERSGKTITKADLLGHDWVVAFIFIDCAGPCPRVSAQMHELQRKLRGTDVRLVTITVNPKVDTPERLAKYADNFEADPAQWLFLTGDMVQIYHLIGNSFKMPVMEVQGEDRKPGFEVMHTTNILHINPQGVVVGKYNSLNDVEMAQLRQALKVK